MHIPSRLAPLLTIRQAASSLAICCVLIGCAATEPAQPADASAVTPEAGYGELSVLIGENVDPNLGAAAVSVDGKILGYLDSSCGLIVAAPSGARAVTVEWETARISDVLIVPTGKMVSVEISPGLIFQPTDPVEREAPSCKQ